jgi:hypothetical protein
MSNKKITKRVRASLAQKEAAQVRGDEGVRKTKSPQDSTSAPPGATDGSAKPIQSAFGPEMIQFRDADCPQGADYPTPEMAEGVLYGMALLPGAKCGNCGAIFTRRERPKSAVFWRPRPGFFATTLLCPTCCDRYNLEGGVGIPNVGAVGRPAFFVPVGGL